MKKQRGKGTNFLVNKMFSLKQMSQVPPLDQIQVGTPLPTCLRKSKATLVKTEIT